VSDDERSPRGDGTDDGLAAARSAATAAAEQSFRLFAPLLGGRGNGLESSTYEADDQRAPDDPFGIGELRRSMRRAVDLYLELAERVFDVSTRSLEQTLKPRLASMTAASSSPTDGVVRVSGTAGTRVSAPIWLHNMTDEPLPPARFQCSDLLGSDGSIIGSGAATIVPPATERLSPGQSVAALLTIEVPAGTPAVVYVGHAVLVPLPDVSLVVRLEVGTAPSEDGTSFL
jgi:hypothetical protein